MDWDIRVFGKQCRPRSDAAERGVWSGLALFAKITSSYRLKKQSKVTVQDHFPSHHSETIDPPVLSVLWFCVLVSNIVQYEIQQDAKWKWYLVYSNNKFILLLQSYIIWDSMWEIEPSTISNQWELKLAVHPRESSLSAWRNFAFMAIQNVPSEDSDRNLRWAHTSLGTIPDVVADFICNTISIATCTITYKA